MLEVKGLTVSYGPIRSVKGVDLEVRTGEIVTLIGANGAGKTTILRALAGLLPFGGEVRFDGQRITPGRAERLVRQGLVLTLAVLLTFRLESERGWRAWAGFGVFWGLCGLTNPTMLSVLPFTVLRRLVLSHR